MAAIRIWNRSRKAPTGTTDLSADISLQLHRMSAVVDNVNAVIMLCDTTEENRIFYVNRAGREILAKYQHSLRSKFSSGADVTRADQRSIHDFHASSDRVRKILKQFELGKTEPHTAIIALGEVTFRTTIYPIWDRDDPSKISCFLAIHTDITADIAAEKGRVSEQRRRELQAEIDRASSNMLEMSKSIDSVASQTSEASRSAEKMTAEAQDGEEIVHTTREHIDDVIQMVTEVSKGMRSLKESSESIGQIVGLIKEVSDQTNLLALNAAIEAARVGEAGQGFAVVAAGVRGLAERAGKSTAQVASIVRDIQDEVQRSAGLIEGSMKRVSSAGGEIKKAELALEHIVREVQTVQQVMTHIAAAMEQQSAATQNVTNSLVEITQSAATQG